MSEIVKPKLYVALPCAGGLMYSECVAALMNTLGGLTAAGISTTVRLNSGSNIARLRNDFAAEFLQTDCTHLLWIDADEGGFTADDVRRMVASGLDVVAAPVPMKCDGNVFVVQFYPENLASGAFETHVSADGSRFLEIPRAGTGFLLIRRHVFDKMMEAHPGLEYFEPNEGREGNTGGGRRWDFFANSLGYAPSLSKNVYCSEDDTFFERWRAMGGKTHLLVSPCPRITHTGQKRWSGDFETYLKNLCKAARRRVRAA
jgi:hypothetical protein